MTEAEALGRIADALSVDSDPALTVDELLGIVSRARRPDGAGNPPSNRAATAASWQASTAYQYGDVIHVNGRFWQCITPGTTAATEPAWPDLGGQPSHERTLNDDDVLWHDIGTEWKPTYSVASAAVEGWELKAGKVADRFGFATDGQTFHRQQLLAHCRRMVRHYKARLGSVA